MTRHKIPNALTTKNIRNTINEGKPTKGLRKALEYLILESAVSLPFSQVGFVRGERLGKEVFKLIMMFNTKNILYHHFRALQTLTLEKYSFVRLQV